METKNEPIEVELPYLGIGDCFDELDIKRYEKAGEVVEPMNYEKRVEALLYQLPLAIVNTIKEHGIWTPGLKGFTVKDDKGIEQICKRWYGEELKFPFTMDDKLDQLEMLKKMAYGMIPKQSRFTEEEVEEAFNEHYQNICDALRKSTLEEKGRIFDEQRMYE